MQKNNQRYVSLVDSAVKKLIPTSTQNTLEVIHKFLSCGCVCACVRVCVWVCVCTVYFGSVYIVIYLIKLLLADFLMLPGLERKRTREKEREKEREKVRREGSERYGTSGRETERDKE